MNLIQARRAGLLAAEFRDVETMQDALAAIDGTPLISIRFDVGGDNVGEKYLKLPYDMGAELLSTARRIIERELDFLGVDVKSMEQTDG